MITSRIGADWTSRDDAKEARDAREHERALRTKKAAERRLESALHDERTSLAAMQRMDAAREALRVQALEDTAEPHDDPLAADAAGVHDHAGARRDDATVRRSPAAARHAAPPNEPAAHAVAGRAQRPPEPTTARSPAACAPLPLDPIDEFDRGWNEAVLSPVSGATRREEGDERRAEAHPPAPAPAPAAPAPAPAAPAAPAACTDLPDAAPAMPEPLQLPVAGLPQDVAAALERLHILAQESSDRAAGAMGEAADAHAVDDRIEGALAFLEGYALDALEAHPGDAAHAQLDALLKKTRERLGALRDKALAEEEIRSTPVGSDAPKGSVAMSAAPQPTPMRPPQPQQAAHEQRVAEERIDAPACGAGSAERRVQGARLADAGSEQAAKELRTAKPQAVARMREALERAEVALDERAMVDERRAATTLPQRVIQSV